MDLLNGFLIKMELERSRRLNLLLLVKVLVQRMYGFCLTICMSSTSHLFYVFLLRFTTHWFKLVIDIPKTWTGQKVQLLWDSGMIWTDKARVS